MKNPKAKERAGYVRVTAQIFGPSGKLDVAHARKTYFALKEALGWDSSVTWEEVMRVLMP